MRSFLVIPRFSNRVEPSPYLEASPIGTVAAPTSASADRIRLEAGYEIDPRRGEPALPEGLRDSGVVPGGMRTSIVYFGDEHPARARARRSPPAAR